MINCEMGVVYFSTHTPPAEIERLTSYDFSCFTRFKLCSGVEDLLPASTEWHLYQEAPQQYLMREQTCDVPAWALARDTRYVLAVEALSAKMVAEGEYRRQMTKVRIVSSLKEPAPWVTGSVITASPFGWEKASSSSSNVERILPGKRYIVFATGNNSRDRMVTRESPLSLERCGLWKDTPETRRELEKGFA